MTKNSVGALILAAGTSSRMGTPKQLLKLNHSSLLEWTIRHVLAYPFEDVLVVTGHEEEGVKSHVGVTSSRLRWITNEDYDKGQGTSFALGMKNLMNRTSTVMVFLGDQPFIQKRTISAIHSKAIKYNQGQDPFVLRPFYKETPGHPVVWGNIDALPLSKITDQGGRQLMKSVVQHSCEIEDPLITIDIDTPADYEKAKRMSHYLT
ncbi:hypothetical protein CR194_04225 [Salipaludibacillus keqinensis]|uniref:MobA-like NTP transferase domain-containing protein n=1 Tax=Salipaludibacillus keqinensis TaxID=2045207 RepID=A0A323TM70_9BACI|nr:nucleotidyltransferase family protein [Salipaludibacillus keqinensis]PYZ94747.1 hypothetical protein CR194_04225 [Salipaludibacillus keqinensis]